MIRFGPHSYDDLMESLTRLRQIGLMEEQKSKLEALSNRLMGLFDNYKLSCFSNSLKDEVRVLVRMFSHTSLIHANRLAKLQEEMLA